MAENKEEGATMEELDDDDHSTLGPEEVRDTRNLTCECYPDFGKVMTTGVPPIPVPPYPDPCCCYGLPEYRKPGPSAYYLGMGYKTPNMRGSEYLRTPGYFPPQPGQEKYTVRCSGRGLLPPYNDGDMKQDSDIAKVFVITGSDGFQVEVTEYGARLMSIRAPDVDGVVKDILLGFDSPEAYWKYQTLHWGGVTGRLSDTIRGPRPNLRVPGVGWCLFPQNYEDDHFMGGEKSLDKVIWDAHVKDNGVLFTYISRAGDEDYPGNVLVCASYTVLPVNKLVITMEATTTVATPFALMLPLTFNLAGHNSGEIAMKDHVLSVRADKYYPRRNGRHVKGVKKSVALTPYDLRIPRHLRKMLRHAPNKSYDVFMCMRQPRPGKEKQQHLMARLFHPEGRRVMEVWSDQPILHIATSLGLTQRPPKPPDPVLLLEARKIILEIIDKIIPCEGLLPNMKKTFIDRRKDIELEEALKELNESRPLPNPGDIRTVPQLDRKESEAVATEILNEILSRVKPRPPVYMGLNSYRYFDDCGIMLYPRLQPLYISKSNVEELILRPGQRYSHTTTYVFSTSPRPVMSKRRRFGRQRPFKPASELMIDHCSAATISLTPQKSYVEIHDVCSAEFSEPSI